MFSIWFCSFCDHAKKKQYFIVYCSNERKSKVEGLISTYGSEINCSSSNIRYFGSIIVNKNQKEKILTIDNNTKYDDLLFNLPI